MLKSLLWGGVILLSVILTGILFKYLTTTTRVATVSVRVVEEMVDTKNVIYTNYEWFHDSFQAWGALLPRITQHPFFSTAKIDAMERNRLRVEMDAIQQTCRELVARYNSNSAKLTRAIFKEWSLPEELNPFSCEVQ